MCKITKVLGQFNNKVDVLNMLQTHGFPLYQQIPNYGVQKPTE